MKALQSLQKHLKPGRVYRRSDLAKWSTAVDRHVKDLLETGVLRKLSGGLYYSPKMTSFGVAPANEKEVVGAFLKDRRFLLTSANAFNSLGVGTTQLHNETVVYNHKRHGRFNLGGRIFDFRKKPTFPKSLSKEFLFVDLLNNMERLPEENEPLLERAKNAFKSLEGASLARAFKEYGTERSKKVFERLSGEMATYAR